MQVEMTMKFMMLISTRRFGIPEFLDSGRRPWALDAEQGTLDAGLWTLKL